MDSPLAAPAPTTSSLTMFFNNGFDMLHDTTGAPNVLDCINPYGLLPSLLYFLRIVILPLQDYARSLYRFHGDFYNKHQHL